MIKNILITGILFFYFTQSLYSQCTLNKSGWTETFVENFNTNITDLKTRWKVFTHTENDTTYFRSIYMESNISFGTDGLHISTKKLPSPITLNGMQYNYSTGAILSKFDDIPFCNNFSTAGYLYGMFEVRCKLPKKKGQYPAFWLWGERTWPPEIDAFEYNGTNHNSFFSTVFWKINNVIEACGNHYFYPFDLTDDFHTWTVVWTPTQVTWFFDNKELKTDNIIQHVPGVLAPNMMERCYWDKMNQQLNSSLNNPDANETTFDDVIFQYVKVYKPNGYATYNTSMGNFDDWHNNIIKPLYLNTPYKSTNDWILDKVLSTDNYNAISNLNVLQGGGKFYYKGDYNLLWSTYWYNNGNGGQFYSYPVDWNYTIDGDVSVAVTNEIPFFKVGPTLRYYQNSVFSSIPGVTNLQSSILTNPNGLQVVYLGTGNNLWQCKRNSLSGTWTKTQITSSSNITTDIIFDPNNYNVIYFRNNSNQLVKLAFNGFAWIPTIISTVNDVFSSLSINPNSNRIYYKTSVNKLIYYELSGSTWTRYPFNAVSPYSGNASVPVDNVAKNICISENPHQIFYIGTDNRIWVVYLDGSTWRSTAIDWKVNYAARDLKITNPTTSNRALCFVGSDNKIRRFFWNTCEVLNPACNGNQYFKQVNGNNNIEINIENKNDAIITPNPASNFIKINLPSDFLGITSLEIYNVHGQKVKQSKTEILTNSIEISDLPNGLYIIKMENSKKTTIQKFYKN